jgi:hypothetical protein
VNTEEYISHLQSELKGFSAQDKAALIEEVAAHIEEGQDDPRLGRDAMERKKKLEAEMGSPNDLGRRLKEIHRPNRWVDFLLVFVPNEVLMYPILIILTLVFGGMTRINSSFASEPYMMASIRVSFLLAILLVIVARLRRSLALLLFWLPQGVITVFTLLFREKRWLPQSPFNAHLVGTIESVFWLILMAILVSWLANLIWTNHQNPLLVVLALIPILITIGNTTLGSYISTGNFPGGYQLPNWNITVINGFPLGLYQISVIIWPLLFYLFQNRQVRWLGLVFYALPLSLMNLLASSSYTELVLVWTIPFILVIFGWLIDKRRYPHQNALVT